MKKLLALILALVMVFALSACGNEDVRGSVTPNPDTNSTDGTTDDAFSLGTTNGGTYNNDYLGISCTLPTGWEFYTDEQILELNNITGDIAGEEIADALNDASIIYDMYAQNSAEGCNLTMVLEKGTVLQVAKSNLEEVAKSQIDSLKSTYQTIGYTDISVVYERFTIDGKQFDGLRLKAKIQGKDFYSCLFLFKKGSYVASVAFGSLGVDKTVDIMNCIKFK